MSVALGAACSGGTVNYNPATGSDSSPPAVNLLITRAGEPDLEVQARTVPSPNLSGDYGNPAPNTRRDFSILATATDPESGIRRIRLTLNRTLCYQTSSGVIARANFATVVRREAIYTDQQNAPTQASLGDTGVIDNSVLGTDSANISQDNLLVWTNANQVHRAGVGVATHWNMETTNFAGLTTYSDVIHIVAGNTVC
jgi:hypothetical protein